MNVAHAAFRGSSRSGRMEHVKMNENMMTMMMVRLRAVWTIALVPFVVNALDATSLSEVPAVALGSGVTSPSEPLEGPTDWESKLSAGLVYKSGNTDSERMTLGLATEKFAGQTLLRAYANGTYETAEVEDEEGRRDRPHRRRRQGGRQSQAPHRRLFRLRRRLGVHDDMADVRYRAVESGGVGVFRGERAGALDGGDGSRHIHEPRPSTTPTSACASPSGSTGRPRRSSSSGRRSRPCRASRTSRTCSRCSDRRRILDQQRFFRWR